MILKRLQNKLFGDLASKSKNQKEGTIASKLHVCSSYFLFIFYFVHLKAYVEGTCELNLLLKYSHRCREWDASKYSSSASSRRIFTRNQYEML